MHYYKRNLGDYARDAGHLTMLEHGAYALIMDAYYGREQAPTRAEALRWARARSADEVAAVDAVLAEFFVLDGEQYRQKRMEAEITAYKALAASARANGMRGGRRPKPDGNRSGSEADTDPGSDRKANHKPLTINQEEPSATPIAPAATRPPPAPKPAFDPGSGRFVNLPDALIQSWATAYPAVDVPLQIARAEAWQLSNPKNRKVDIPGFLNRWLAKAQDQARPSPQGGPHDARSQRDAERAAAIAHLTGRTPASAGFMGREIIQPADGDLWDESAAVGVSGG